MSPFQFEIGAGVVLIVSLAFLIWKATR